MQFIKTHEMKKLFLKNGIYLDVKTSTETEGRYISVYTETERLKYSIFEGKSITNRTLNLADNTTEIPLYEITQVAEVIENFNQYFNFLNQ